MVADFHRLRIRCKRLRYSLEFSSELYGGRTARFVRQLTALQDQLGLMQDAEVASARLADLATGEAHLPAATVFVMGGVAELHRREMDRLLDGCPRRCPGLDGRAWRDLRELMERRRDRGRRRPGHGCASRCGPCPRRPPEATGRGGVRPGRHGPPGRAARAHAPWRPRLNQAKGNEAARRR